MKTPDRQYKNSCTLIVPDLLKKLPDDEEFNRNDKLQLKSLEMLLAKAKQQSHELTGFEKNLFELFGISTSLEKPLAIAPVSYLADTGNKTAGWCLRADPVHLTPDRDELVLSGPESLSLSMSEAEHLVTELNVLFEENGWRLEAQTAERWYLHLPEDPQITTSDLSQVRDKSIGGFLPGGLEGKQWHRIMNEVQMVLHSSKVNSERQSHGQLPVSSLWFWGGGKLPEFGHSDWSQVWSDEILSLGLAKVTRTPCFSIPENSKDWLAQVNAPGEHLIICDDFALQKQGQNYNDPEAWCSALKEFESKWLIPLLESLRNGDIDQLTVNPCDGRTFSLAKNRLKHWWRRRKPIHSYGR